MVRTASDSDADWLPVRPLAFAASLLGSLTVSAGAAFADCDNHTPASGATVTCSPPVTDTTGVAAAAASTNVTVEIQAGAGISVVRTTTPAAVSVMSNSQVTNNGAINLSGNGGTGTNRGAGLVGMSNGNTITSSGTITTTGAFNDAMAANGSGNTLTNNGTITTAGPNAYGMTAAWGQTNVGQTNNTLINNGSIITNGGNARGASILGQNGVILNTGTITTNGSGSTAAYLQGNNDRLTNSGTIHATGIGAEAVFSNTVGSAFTVRIENLASGRIISDQGPALRALNGATTIVNAGLIQSGAGNALTGGNGAVTFVLQTGSQIVGLADGGNGSNQVRLQGSGLVDSTFTRFQTLTMEGMDWTWNGTGDFANTFVNTGTLRLQSALAGNATVASGATLEASAQTLTPP